MRPAQWLWSICTCTHQFLSLDETWTEYWLSRSRGILNSPKTYSTYNDYDCQSGTRWILKGWTGRWALGCVLLRRYQMPVAMIINSSEWRAAGFTLREMFLQELEAAAHRSCTRGVGVRHFQGTGHKRFMLSVDDDTEFRSRCHWIHICVFWWWLLKQKMIVKMS